MDRFGRMCVSDSGKPKNESFYVGYWLHSYLTTPSPDPVILYTEYPKLGLIHWIHIADMLFVGDAADACTYTSVLSAGWGSTFVLIGNNAGLLADEKNRCDAERASNHESRAGVMRCGGMDCCCDSTCYWCVLAMLMIILIIIWRWPHTV